MNAVPSSRLIYLRHGFAGVAALLVVDLLMTGLPRHLSGARLLPAGLQVLYFHATLALNVLLLVILVGGAVLRQRLVLRIGLLGCLLLDTARLLANVGALIKTLPQFKDVSGGFSLLWDAIVIWLINVTIFGVWYWYLDGGGPLARHLGTAFRRDFRFTQEVAPLPGWDGWRPGLPDYLFVALTTSVTIGPADTAVLSPRAKVLMALEVALSIAIFSVLAARAVSALS